MTRPTQTFVVEVRIYSARYFGSGVINAEVLEGLPLPISEKKMAGKAQKGGTRFSFWEPAEFFCGNLKKPCPGNAATGIS